MKPRLISLLVGMALGSAVIATAQSSIGTSLSLGTNPAAAGTLRLPNATYITARNAANSGDVNMIRIDSSDQVAFAQGANFASYLNAGGDIATTGSHAVTGLLKLSSLSAGILRLGNSDYTQVVFVGPEVSNVWAQRNTTTAQILRVYETWTDTSNYERFSFTTGSNIFSLIAETAGTGSDDIGIVLTPAGTGIVTSSSVLKAAGYQSSDGTVGVTGTCEGFPTVKNGLVTGCTGI